MSTNITEKKRKLKQRKKVASFFSLPLESAAERGKHDLVATVNIHTNTDDARNWTKGRAKTRSLNSWQQEPKKMPSWYTKSYLPSTPKSKSSQSPTA
jgi:hypothetical protein